MVVTAECTRALSNGTKIPTTISHTLGLVVHMKQGAVLFGNSVYFIGYFYDNGKKSCKYSLYY